MKFILIFFSLSSAFYKVLLKEIFLNGSLRDVYHQIHISLQFIDIYKPYLLFVQNI